MPEPLPYQMSERELVVRFLRRRADWWSQYPQHQVAAEMMRREAALIELGHHDKMRQD